MVIFNADSDRPTSEYANKFPVKVNWSKKGERAPGSYHVRFNRDGHSITVSRMTTDYHIWELVLPIATKDGELTIPLDRKSWQSAEEIYPRAERQPERRKFIREFNIFIPTD